MASYLKIITAIAFFVLTQKISLHKKSDFGEYELKFQENKNIIKRIALLNGQEFWVASLKTKRKATDLWALRLNLLEIRQPVFFTDCLAKKTTKAKFSFKQTLQCKRGPPLA